MANRIFFTNSNQGTQADAMSNNTYFTITIIYLNNETYNEPESFIMTLLYSRFFAPPQTRVQGNNVYNGLMTLLAHYL